MRARSKPRQSTRAILAGSALLLSLPLAGCRDDYLDRRDSVTLGVGDAVATNAAAQTIDPWPAAARDRFPQTDGERVRNAVERYKKNEEFPAKTLRNKPSEAK